MNSPRQFRGFPNSCLEPGRLALTDQNLILSINSYTLNLLINFIYQYCIYYYGYLKFSLIIPFSS